MDGLTSSSCQLVSNCHRNHCNKHNSTIGLFTFIFCCNTEDYIELYFVYVREVCGYHELKPMCDTQTKQLLQHELH